MNSIFDFENLDNVRTEEDLHNALKSTFTPNLPVSPEFIYSTRGKLADIARKMDCYGTFRALLDDLERDFKNCNYQTQILQKCDVDRRGNLLNTTDNYLTIMTLDPAYSEVRMNEMSMRPETKDEKTGKTRAWTDADDAASRAYIEKAYGMHSFQKHSDALSILFEMRKYHPIKSAVEAIKWDGVSRIENLLHTWMGTEDTEYTREVSRLIFAGGIHRLYNPGCKFEDMPVLVGGQGAGKSTFVRWLAIEDTFFTELATIEGKEGMETIDGAWIVEVSELLALTKTREQEAVKAYLSRLVDKYRPAFGRRTIERPRTCTFIGTTNREQFITDKTGGRRFYPIRCENTGYWLFDHEEECRAYIRQCWAEALVKMDTPFMDPYAKREIKPQMEEKQEAAAEEDIRVGIIEKYLEDCRTDAVCIGMIWEEALQQDHKMPEKADQTQIGLIMRNMKNWKRVDYKRDFGRYGKQKFWKRVQVSEPTFTTPNDWTPY